MPYTRLLTTRRSEDLRRYLDSKPRGVILFSLGSNVRSVELGPEAIAAFLAAFAEVPLDILWKWESDELPGKPSNVHVARWLPQNDILAHRNVKAFITHSGMLSTMEAVYHGVPMVGIPFLADQFSNIAKAVDHGVAVRLNYHSLTKEAILSALDAVVNDTSYRERMQQLSRRFRDRPQSALETAVFWTEYVLRHGGAHHLRCASLDLAWYQRTMLDVWACLLAAGGALCWLLYRLLRALVARAWATQPKQKAA